MPLGTDRDISTVNQGDTADLYAYVFDSNSNPLVAGQIADVDFVVQDPTGAQTTLPGSIEADGAGFLRYDTTGNSLGEYVVVAKFTLTSGEKRSTRLDFTVVDPFTPVVPTKEEVIADGVWMMLEDCFDSEEGGPWLRDMTLSFFDRNKIKQFIPYAMMQINNTNPLTTLDLSTFVIVTFDTGGIPVSAEPTGDIPVVVYGTLIQVIRHLMRAYVEQPANMGSEIAFEDRRDYLQRWQLIIQDMLPDYQQMLILWKRQFLNLGKSALLDSMAKATRPGALETPDVVGTSGCSEYHPLSG
jgi:hypothetical protein